MPAVSACICLLAWAASVALPSVLLMSLKNPTGLPPGRPSGPHPAVVHRVAGTGARRLSNAYSFPGRRKLSSGYSGAGPGRRGLIRIERRRRGDETTSPKGRSRGTLQEGQGRKEAQGGRERQVLGPDLPGHAE